MNMKPKPLPFILAATFLFSFVSNGQRKIDTQPQALSLITLLSID